MTQTTLHFDRREHWNLEAYLHLDQGGHKPSPQEDLLAPFYQDASQRVLAIELHDLNSVFVMKTEVLLQLARERGDTDLEWEEWKAHAVEVQPGGGYVGFWVSSPRLFRISWPKRWDEEMLLDVYDFSARASAQYMETVTDRNWGFSQVMQPSIQKHHLPRDVSARLGVGHGGIVFLTVNTPRSQNLTNV